MDKLKRLNAWAFIRSGMLWMIIIYKWWAGWSTDGKGDTEDIRSVAFGTGFQTISIDIIIQQILRTSNESVIQSNKIDTVHNRHNIESGVQSIGKVVSRVRRTCECIWLRREEEHDGGGGGSGGLSKNKLKMYKIEMFKRNHSYRIYTFIRNIFICQQSSDNNSRNTNNNIF